MLEDLWRTGLEELGSLAEAEEPPAGSWPSSRPAHRPHLGLRGDGQAVPAGASTVEITLEPDPDGTRVRLRHTGLPATEPPRAHLAGWRHALATLAYNGSADQLAPVLGERVADWLATGTNVAGTDLDGRFRWVTGFWDPPAEPPEAPQRP